MAGVRDHTELDAWKLSDAVQVEFSRYYPRDFARFVRIARGSLSELLDHLKVARRRRVIDNASAEALETLVRRARGACTGLLRYLESTHPSGPATR